MMNPVEKTQKHLVNELVALRQRLTELEAAAIEQKRLAEEVQAARVYAESIVDTMREPLMVLDADLRVLSANRSFYQTFQVTAGETEHRHLYALGNRQWDIPALRTLLEQILPESTVFNDFEVTHDFSHIGQRTMLLNARRVLREGTGIAMILLAIEDITEHKRMEEALRQHRDWFDVMLSCIGDAVIATDTNALITFINPVAEQLTGYTAREALGRHVDEVYAIINEHTRQATKNPIVRVLEEGHIVGLTNHTMLIARDGREILLADSGAPIRSKDGILEGVVLVFRDISQDTRIRDELLRARKIESVSMLAGGLAHDFNNLLTGIMGNISLAKMSVDAHEKAFTRLMEAEKACQRATALTHQLLTFSKGGAPVLCTASIAELIRESTGFVLRGSNVRADLAIAEDLWPVDVDAGQMSQVLHNVVLNAAQAMPGGGRVRVQAENVLLRAGGHLPLHEGRYVKIFVQDQGAGIPAEVLPNIFDPYFTTKEGGSGLGLATSYAIITKHEGYITAESEVNVGATFSIYLPASQHAIPPAPAVSETPVGGSGRILVMDDEEVIRNLLTEMLTSMGYEVICTREGTETIALYESAQATGRPFSAVLLDFTIPEGMGGRGVIEHLRAIDPQVKAILSSGYANDPVMANFQQYGFSGVVAKPYTIQGLHNTLQRIMRGRGH